jgi:uncharacterized Tic20 family protein
VLHLSSIFCIVIIPLLLWSWKKNQSYKINQHGRQVLNFQITMTLVLFAAGFLLITLPVAILAFDQSGLTSLEGSPFFIPLMVCALLPLVLAGLFCTYQGAVNAMRALADKPIRYALSIPFVK